MTRLKKLTIMCSAALELFEFVSTVIIDTVPTVNIG